MDTVNPTRTVVCPLETSNRKNKRVEKAIADWQRLAERIGNLLVGFPEHRWGNEKDTHLYRLLSREAEKMDVSLKKGDAHEAAKKVTTMYQSYLSNGKPGEKPSFGGGNYVRFRGDSVTLADNGSGYGLKIGIEPYKPEWWRCQTRPYHDEYFEPVCSGESSIGASELHLNDGNLTAHVSVSTPVEVYEPRETDGALGIDLGERVIFAAAAVDGDGTVDSVEMRTGDEFRHHRTELTRQYREQMRKGNLTTVKELRGQRERYTKHVAHEVSETITRIAAEGPYTIVLEDLSDYRQTAADPIHDMPFSIIQEFVSYKATAKGVPVVTVEPAYTSTTCRECGSHVPSGRDGIDFLCPACGYEVHADVNAAINIANRHLAD